MLKALASRIKSSNCNDKINASSSILNDAMKTLHSVYNESSDKSVQNQVRDAINKLKKLVCTVQQKTVKAHNDVDVRYDEKLKANSHKEIENKKEKQMNEIYVAFNKWAKNIENNNNKNKIIMTNNNKYIQNGQFYQIKNSKICLNNGQKKQSAQISKLMKAYNFDHHQIKRNKITDLRKN